MRKDLPNRYLLLIDIVGIILAFTLSTWIRYGQIQFSKYNNGVYGVAFTIILAAYIIIYYIYNTYRNLFKRGFLDEMIEVIKLNLALVAVLTAVMFLFQEGASYSRAFFLCFILLNTLITYILRQYYKILLVSFFKKSNSCTRLMVMTTARQAKNILERIHKENAWYYQVVYFTIIDRSMIGKSIGGIPVKADISNMYDIAKQEAIDSILIHIPEEDKLSINLEETILQFENMGSIVNLSINTFGLRLNEKVIRELSGYHVLTFSSKLYNGDHLLLKRVMDIIGGLVGCIFTVIITIFLAPAIYIESPGPIFFSQVRIGKNGRRFRIYKFRSMYPDAEKRLNELMAKNEMNGLMFKLTDDPRVTKIGKFIRKTSLDEFPQFLNVLLGDMSLVGTRPPTESEFLQYEGRHKRRLALKAGLTGLWQVSGRSDINDFEEVVRLDLEYIDNWSLKTDVKILIKTLQVVLFGRGAK
jgi:exopolysaccharide biosynthesis polyprenyl glycosylphosphotransferase